MTEYQWSENPAINLNESVMYLNQNKADINLSNLSPSAQAYLASLASQSNSYNSENKFITTGANHTSLKILAGTNIKFETSQGLRFFHNDEDTSISIPQTLDSGELEGGKDYSLFLVADSSSELLFKTSLNNITPIGYSQSDVKKIGGFHTMCASVNETNAPESAHPAISYREGDIVPNSIWCLSHRPKSSPRGMAYVDLLDIWVDIYPQSGKDGEDTSVFGGSVLHTRTWEDHTNDMRLTGKRLPFDHEYSILGEGANQNTAVSGELTTASDTAGAHKDVNGKYMISNYFLWETQGLRWCWLANVCADGATNQWIAHDSLNGTKGKLWGASFALLAGGSGSDSPYCGSRCRAGNTPRNFSAYNIGARGVSEALYPSLIIQD